MTETAIDGVAEEVEVQPDEERAAIVPAAGPSTLAVTPSVEAGELVSRLAVIKEASEKAMKDGVDYGTVGGTNKPTLLKPGAEKLSVLFQLDVQIENEKHFEADGHLTVVSKATVYHAPTGSRLGYGEGLCTTREKKYAKRRQDLKCPDCGEETVLKSKKDPEFFCWKKKGGCGHTFPETDERLSTQEVGEKDNPDLPDTWNTVVKMGEKRARVDAVLAVTGASALFTQDLDERMNEPAAPAPIGFTLATPEEKKSLEAALMDLLPEEEAEAAWGTIKQKFGGDLYGPAAQAIVAVLDAKKALD